VDLPGCSDAVGTIDPHRRSVRWRRIIIIVSIWADRFRVDARPKKPERAGNRAGDKRADVIENNADALRGQAAALDNSAEAVRDTAESRTDAIKAADMKVRNMTQEQRDAIVANQAPAVR